ncbi:MAG: glycosyl transferase family 1 [Acidobacteria bacterium]|nr:MAG: glycosyl transferase family 1 [Acidobacteriota bacterium]
MKIVIAHNAYQQSGGEDAVVSAEKTLLLREGNEVNEYLRHNNEIKAGNICSNIALGVRTVWSSSSRSQLYRLLQSGRPDVVHFHNTFPLISPAAYYACRELGVPVVQTLHNYRLFCPAGAFFRDGQVCEDCLDKNRWQAVRHACYRQSRSASATVAAMLSFHHGYGTWTNLVNCYIALSEFSRAKFIEAGLPPKKIAVKPNFVVSDPGVGPEQREYAVFLGRLSEEKGIRNLIQAWAKVSRSFTLRVIGDGPLLNEVRSEISHSGFTHIRLDGRLLHQESTTALQGARILILPSKCYENFPVCIAEAFACGTPVIASRLGAMQEIVQDGRTGLHFTPGDADDLAEKVEWAWAHSEEMREMGRNARAEFEAKYTAELNYTMLFGIYQQAISGITQPANEHGLE